MKMVEINFFIRNILSPIFVNQLSQKKTTKYLISFLPYLENRWKKSPWLLSAPISYVQIEECFGGNTESEPVAL